MKLGLANCARLQRRHQKLKGPIRQWLFDNKLCGGETGVIAPRTVPKREFWPKNQAKS